MFTGTYTAIVTPFKQGKIDEKVFSETRLRRGTYGQRYDNGQRHDGIESRTLSYPSELLTKGPSTLWDAPGMQRIKIPFGGLNARQLEVLAELAEEGTPPQRRRPGVSGSEHKRVFSPPAAPAPKAGRRGPSRAGGRSGRAS